MEGLCWTQDVGWLHCQVCIHYLGKMVKLYYLKVKISWYLDQDLFVDELFGTRIKIAVFRTFGDMQSMESLNGSFVLTKDIETIEGPEHYAIVQVH